MRRWLRIGGSADSPNYPPVHANAVLAGLLFFPGSCFDRQIFQCIVSIITIWTLANYLRSKVGRSSKSIMRMLSPDVDPDIKAFIAVVRAAEHQSEKAADLDKTH